MILRDYYNNLLDLQELRKSFSYGYEWLYKKWEQCNISKYVINMVIYVDGLISETLKRTIKNI